MIAREARIIVVHGRVQGVGYRAWLAGEARRRSLSGWVRNRRDGTVEAEIHGDAEAVASLVEACHAGPRAARVVAVVESAAEANPLSGEFAILPTL